jgi:hypothetical protein
MFGASLFRWLDQLAASVSHILRRHHRRAMPELLLGGLHAICLLINLLAHGTSAGVTMGTVTTVTE